MATARGDEPGRYAGNRSGGERYAGDRFGDDRPAGSARPRPQQRPSLLSEIAETEPDRLTAGRRVGAAIALAIVVLALAVGAGALVSALFGLVG
jgi:hypothetical protein